ncbi:hypothetical protein E2562_023009 [Oryza meyeriana var. granulata]|uniref:DUF834 domain-containing protein n=1 Tax=Oryza meyeriana var. granulata TaxID=110450 RepID=A0A6G1EYI7_9ORYZ|nr:hypothetical protein E2562_023009 [Oryza meyeriana var. granulata]
MAHTHGDRWQPGWRRRRSAASAEGIKQCDDDCRRQGRGPWPGAQLAGEVETRLRLTPAAADGRGAGVLGLELGTRPARLGATGGEEEAPVRPREWNQCGEERMEGGKGWSGDDWMANATIIFLEPGEENRTKTREARGVWGEWRWE